MTSMQSVFWQHFANNGNDVARPELAATAAATMGGTVVAAVTTPTSRGRDRRAKRARGLAGRAVVLGIKKKKKRDFLILYECTFFGGFFKGPRSLSPGD